MPGAFYIRRWHFFHDQFVVPDGDIGVRPGAPGSFERPASFDPRTAFPADPKQIGYGADESIDAIVRIDALRAAAGERELGAERVVGRESDGTIRVSVPAGNRAAFRSWVLGLLEHAVVESPPDLRQHIIEWLGAVADNSARAADGPVRR